MLGHTASRIACRTRAPVQLASAQLSAAPSSGPRCTSAAPRVAPGRSRTDAAPCWHRQSPLFQRSLSSWHREQFEHIKLRAAVDNAQKNADFLQKEDELNGIAESRLAEVLAEVDARVASGKTAAEPAHSNSNLYHRLSAAVDAIQEGLIERDVEVRLMLLAALSGEHVLFIGPPGTAKSELGRRLSRIYNGAFFERLLTRFSVPEELFGPLSMQALEEDKYVRQIEGYLPSASVAFIDEIFKANSAILNTLLTILNERLFDNGTERLTVPLICLVGASNELPESEELDALYDRFLVRREVKQVSAGNLNALLRTPDTAAGRGGSSNGAGPRRGGGEALVTHEDFSSIREEAQRTVTVPDEVLGLLADLRDMLQTKMEPPVYVSDRRLVKAIALLKVSAYTNGRREVSVQDCLLLQHLMWQRPLEADRIGEWLLEQLADDADVRQCDYLLNSLFSRAVKGDDEARSSMKGEVVELRKVLAGKLAEVQASSRGRMPELTSHLWLGAQDAAAAATSLAPKLRKSQTHISRLLSEAVSLEVGLECAPPTEELVALATLLPDRWHKFISGGAGAKKQK